MLLSTCFQRFQLSAVPKWRKRSLKMDGQRVMEKKGHGMGKGPKGTLFGGWMIFHLHSVNLCKFRSENGHEGLATGIIRVEVGHRAESHGEACNRLVTQPARNKPCAIWHQHTQTIPKKKNTEKKNKVQPRAP